MVSGQYQAQPKHYIDPEAMGRTVRGARMGLTYGRMVAILLAVGLLVGGRAVDVWLLFAVLLGACARLAVGRAFPRLVWGLRLDRTRLFAGERVRLAVRLANPSWWPLPWLEVESRQPEGLSGALRRVEWLPGGAVRRLGVDWFAAERGVYRVGGLALRGGDWFGLFRGEREVAAALDLVVYPRVRPVDGPEPRRRLPEGPRKDLLSPFEDDLPAGLRPYRPGDQRRRIAWRASARHDGLLVREMPPVREAAACLCLDLRPQAWAGRNVEQAISLAASLACGPALGARPLGLLAWAGTTVKGVPGGRLDGPGRAIWLPPGRGGASDRRRLLEVLAGLRPDEDGAPALHVLLETFARRLPWGTHAIWVAAEDRAELRRAAAAWQARGRPVTLLCLERRAGPAVARAGGQAVHVWEVAADAGFTLR